MNISALRKNYDKLTAEERVSAMFAAMGRGDEAELNALDNSAPLGNKYRFKDFYGLMDSFKMLRLCHAILQLGSLTSLYFLFFHDDIDEERIKTAIHHLGEDETMILTRDEAIEKCICHILQERDAWRAICAEYNINPSDSLTGVPYAKTIEVNEMLMSFMAEASGLEIDHTKDLEAYRDAIKRHRAEWE